MSLGTGALKVGREPERLRLRNDLLSNSSPKISSKMPAWDATLSYKISKRPLRSPHRSRTLEEKTADRVGLEFNFV